MGMTVKSKESKKRLSRWEIVLLIVLTPIIYLAFSYMVISTEYDYPHRKLIHLFNSDLMPYIIILGFDMLWLVFVKYLPLGSKRTRIYRFRKRMGESL